MVNPCISATGVFDYLRGRIAKWRISDEVLFIERIPIGATGKIDKKALRRLWGHRRRRRGGYALGCEPMKGAFCAGGTGRRRNLRHKS